MPTVSGTCPLVALVLERFGICSVYSVTERNRKAFAMTETELKLIAAPAMIGLSKMPKNGYSTPAAIGTPSEL